MDSYPIRTAKDQLSALVGRVESTHERVTITRSGHAAAVSISPEDLAALEETLDVLSDPATLAGVRESRAELERGEGLNEAQLRELIGQQRL